MQLMLVIKHLSRTPRVGPNQPPALQWDVYKSGTSRRAHGTRQSIQQPTDWDLSQAQNPARSPFGKDALDRYIFDVNLTLLLSFFRYVTHLRPHRPYLGDRLAPT